MGVRAAHPLEVVGSRARKLSLAALALSGLGVMASTWMIVASDGDSSQVVWPLVVAPVVICLLPVLSPHSRVRIGATFALGASCIVGMFSIGFTQLPALGAAVAAAIREEP